MMSDERLAMMVRATTRAIETVEVYDAGFPNVVVATVRGAFTKNFPVVDSDPSFNAQFDHTVDGAMFVCRTVDLANVKNKMKARYKGETPNVIYEIMDRRHDGHGMSALVLHR